MAQKRLHCLSCSAWLVPWGKTASGKKRYCCPLCGKTRTFRKARPKQREFFSLFWQFVLWGETYEILSHISGYSIRYLFARFQYYLSHDPPESPLIDQSKLEEAYLLIDGLWFGRWFVLMVYRQHKNLTILHISVAGKEVETKISKDLRHLVELGYRFTGIVSDGGKGIVKAINIVFPHIPHQVCLAHMHRDIINALGRYPKDERVRRLKILADHLWLIESKEALQWWQGKLKDWLNHHWKLLLEYHRDETGRWWYIHKGLRKAVRILRHLPKVSFTFLDHPLMPKTTNELEAQFGHLGKRWLAHRGLKKERWENFLKWFVYFYNLEKLSSRKQKKD